MLRFTVEGASNTISKKKVRYEICLIPLILYKIYKPSNTFIVSKDTRELSNLIKEIESNIKLSNVLLIHPHICILWKIHLVIIPIAVISHQNRDSIESTRFMLLNFVIINLKIRKHDLRLIKICMELVPSSVAQIDVSSLQWDGDR